MKILLLMPSLFTIGGIQKFSRNLFDALDLGFRENEFTAVLLLDKKNNAFKIWRNFRLLFCGEIPGVFLKKVLFGLKASKVVLFRRPQYIICGHINLSWLVLFFKKTFAIKYVVIAHGKEIWEINKGVKFNALKNADLILAVSQYTKLRMMNNGISESKIEILCNAVDTDFFVPKARSVKLAENLKIATKKVLLTVARVVDNRHKGFDEMLKAMEELKEEYVWLVVGSGNGLLGLIKKAQQLKIEHKIRFCSQINDPELVDYYNLCDVFVMPSNEEGFGIVFLEALSCGKPVIAGNRDGSGEPLMKGKLGILVNPDKIKELVEAIKKICAQNCLDYNPEFLRTEVINNFGIPVFNKKLEVIFSRWLR